jgi:uncharacterized small protein (DUF1192 family)
MTIKSRISWPLRILYLAIAVGVGGAMVLWGYDLGQDLAGFSPRLAKEQLTALKEEINILRAERDQFSATANAAESRINIARSAQNQLVTQVKALEAENIKLKEDLAFFESLLPADSGKQEVSIRSLKVDVVAPNELHYRLLIMRGGRRSKEFVGNLQLAVTISKDGNSAMINFPEGKNDDAGKFKLEFKHYQRVEGILTLPDGAVMQAVQARVLEKGQIRAQQSVNL